MKLFRGLALGLTAALLTSAVVPADEPQKDDTKNRAQARQVQPGRGQNQPGRGQTQPGRGFGQQPLLTKDAIDKLKFTDDQQKQFDKIDTEYKDKQKEVTDKFREAIQSGDAEKIREATQTRTTDSQKLRTDYLVKVEGLLTDDQKKTFAEVKNEQPGRGNFQPGGGRGTIGRGANTQPTGDVLTKSAQDKLKLSDEQKKKIEELQKNVNDQLNSILTDEQKKQLEDLKKEATQAPGTGRRGPGNNNP